MEMNARNQILKTAILIRCVENRLLELFSAGKLFGTIHTCIGEELTGAMAAQFLTEDDYVFSNHRCHGHCIAVTGQVEGLIAEIMGRKTGLCGGWGGSQHLYYKRFFSNGIQGGFVPITAGLALGEKLRNSTNIACCFIGEGTLGEGVVYESANLISKWSLAALIIIENNRYSQSTPQELTIAGEILDRFKAFEIRCYDTDTWNLESLYHTVDDAVSYS
jgi:2-oxoisovalerate dehydrogenase E1 component